MLDEQVSQAGSDSSMMHVITDFPGNFVGAAALVTDLHLEL
ncbi:MAG: hypothetical protein R3330_19970 [Saprospiraceae bacterium]|nr:hypothetical protein [Saprospiraceae bacterium]